MGELSNTTINGVSYDFKDAGAARQSHSHTKSQITDFPTSMPASDVSAWAKASTKPTYTASEVGAVPNTAAGVSAAINQLTTGDSAPTDNDYYVSQYAGGGTSTTTYHRRPVSKLWDYIKSKLASKGSATQPVYFSNGVPVATTYTLGKSVPSDAKFTDTTYSAATTSAAGLMSAADKTKLNGIATGANNYTHPTTAGNKHVPSGGSSGQILVYGGSSGAASWGNISSGAISLSSFLSSTTYTLVNASLFYQDKHIFGVVNLRANSGEAYTIGTIQSAYIPNVTTMYGLAIVETSDGYKPTYFYWTSRSGLKISMAPAGGDRANDVFLHFDYLTA